MDTCRILLDVGGTYIKCSDGRSIPVDSNGTRDEIASSLSKAVEGYSCACVAIPGPFDYSTGTFLMKHKFMSVYGEKFQELARIQNCRFTHDVNAMLLGEVAPAKAKGFNKVALVSIGTGLGFSVSICGNILTDELGAPLFHIYNRPFKDGILEDYVSKRGFLRGYEGITVKELADMARNGDAGAIGRFNECGRILAEVLSPMLSDLSIECLLFGGQISRSFDLFRDAFISSLSSVDSLREVNMVSDIDNATFNGLSILFD